MGIVYTILMFLLGVLGAANLIAAKSSAAADLIKPLRPIQGYLGVAGFVVGVYWLIQCVLHLGSTSVISFVTAGTMMALGLLMGVGILKAFVSESLVEKLSPYQGVLGVVAIVLAIWSLIA